MTSVDITTVTTHWFQKEPPFHSQILQTQCLALLCMSQNFFYSHLSEHIKAKSTICDSATMSVLPSSVIFFRLSVATLKCCRLICIYLIFVCILCILLQCFVLMLLFAILVIGILFVHLQDCRLGQFLSSEEWLSQFFILVVFVER